MEPDLEIEDSLEQIVNKACRPAETPFFYLKNKLAHKTPFL